MTDKDLSQLVAYARLRFLGKPAQVPSMETALGRDLAYDIHRKETVPERQDEYNRIMALAAIIRD